MYTVFVLVFIALAYTAIDAMVNGPFKLAELLINFVLFGTKLIAGLAGIALVTYWSLWPFWHKKLKGYGG